MKAVAQHCSAILPRTDIAKLEKEGQYNLSVDDEDLILQTSEVEITSEDIPGWMVANKGALDSCLGCNCNP